MALNKLVLLAALIKTIYSLKSQSTPLPAPPTTIISLTISNNCYVKTKTFTSFFKPII